MYDLIIIKIEERKRHIQSFLKTKYWGLDFDCGADYSNDDYLNELFKKLESLAKKEEFIRHSKNRRGTTLRALAGQYKIAFGTLENRIYNLRWSLDKALTTPVEEIKGKLSPHKIKSVAAPSCRQFKN